MSEHEHADEQAVAPVQRETSPETLLRISRVMYVIQSINMIGIFVVFNFLLKVNQSLEIEHQNDQRQVTISIRNAVCYAIYYPFLVSYLFSAMHLFELSQAVTRRLLILLTSYSVYQCFVKTNELMLARLARSCTTVLIRTISTLTSGSVSEGDLAIHRACDGVDLWYNYSDIYFNGIQYVVVAWYAVTFAQIVSIFFNNKLESILVRLYLSCNLENKSPAGSSELSPVEAKAAEAGIDLDNLDRGV